MRLVCGRREARPDRGAPAGCEVLKQSSGKVCKSWDMSPVEPESDLTRKQRREQAREERKAIEEASAAQSAQRKRLIQLGGVAAVVVVIIAIILVATGAGEKRPAHPTSPAAKTAQGEVVSLLQGIPQHTITLGQPQRADHAPVLRRPGVPVLQGVHGQRAADRDQEVREAPARSRSSTTRCRPPRANAKPSRPSRSRRWPPASRT